VIPGKAFMNSIATVLWRFFSSEDGPTAVEYAVMLSLIFSVCIAAVTVMGSNVAGVFMELANSIH
jgi:pilus assembly protein Flp/PilA